MCREQVLTPGTETDDPSIFGELAHIVARRAGGPRAGGLDESKLDSHDNLMLLCNKHHKQVDDQPGHFTVEKLRGIKASHAKWVASLGAAPRQMGLVPDPAYPTPRQLTIIATGHQLWTMIQDCAATSYTYPDRLPEDDADYIVDFLDLIRDYADLKEDLTSVRQHRDAGKALAEYINDLGQRGYLVGAYMQRLLLGGGAGGEPMSLVDLHVQVQRADDAVIVDKEGKRLGVNDFSRDGSRLFFLWWLGQYGAEHPGEPAPLAGFFREGQPSERQEQFWRDLIRELRNEGLILCFESLEFWSSSATLTDQGRATLESKQG
jgi:hypothetical protein